MGEENKKNSRKWMAGAGMAVLLVLAFVIGLLTPPIFKSGKSQEANTVSGTTAAGNAEETNVAEKTETSGADEEKTTDAEDEETKVTEAGTTAVDENTTTAQASGETTAAGAGESTEGLTVTVGHTNEWGDAPHYIQLDGKIVNGTDKTVDGWTVEIAVGNATVDQNWSGNCSIADGVLTITNVDYNEVLEPGGSCDFGVIICDATGDLSATITAGSFTDAANQNQSNNQNQNNNNQGGQTQVNATALPVPDPTTDDWLSVKGNKIVDKDGNEVWLTGINWFGYNTGTNTFDGLWACDLNTSLQAIANRGFNLMRIPISAELILQWKNGEYPTANFNQATNFLSGGDEQPGDF